MEYTIADLNLLEIKGSVSDGGKTGQFIIEPLSPGYGVTIGNTLRRILLASLEGCAIKSVKITNADHEYSTLKGVKEDVVDLILNLKTTRFRMIGEGPIRLELSVKGPKKVTAADFKKSSSIEVIEPERYLATLEKGGKLDLEVEIDRGMGYEPVEKRTEEKPPIGTILVDSIYTPVKKVRFEVENTRVGGMTNYNRLTIDISTDGSLHPAEALSQAAKIMNEHMQIVIDGCEKIKSETTKRIKKSAGKIPKVKKTKNKRKEIK